MTDVYMDFYLDIHLLQDKQKDQQFLKVFNGKTTQRKQLTGKLFQFNDIEFRVIYSASFHEENSLKIR